MQDVCQLCSMLFNYCFLGAYKKGVRRGYAELRHLIFYK